MTISTPTLLAKEAAVNRFEADIAFAARASARRMPSADILARYQASARDAARRSGARVDTTETRLRAFVIAMTAPNSATVR
jgi:hypothetical protein